MEDHKFFIGKTLERLRRQRQLSQEELAFRSSVDRTYISKLERNIQAPSLGTTFSLAKGLSMEKLEFIKEILNEPNNK